MCSETEGKATFYHSSLKMSPFAPVLPSFLQFCVITRISCAVAARSLQHLVPHAADKGSPVLVGFCRCPSQPLSVVLQTALLALLLT